jgi:hypothetical protein
MDTTRSTVTEESSRDEDPTASDRRGTERTGEEHAHQEAAVSESVLQEEQREETTHHAGKAPETTEEAPGAATVLPRVVEGSIVESTIISSELPLSPSAEAQYQRRRGIHVHLGMLAAWGLPLLLVAVLLVAQFAPSLARPLARFLPGLFPTATVTIFPDGSQVHRTDILTAVTNRAPDARRLEVPARLLTVTSSQDAQTVPTTGAGHTPARKARGSLTFYNAAPYAQTVARGTVFTGADGVRVLTDQLAIIPAGAPPTEGQVSVSAHAVSTGPRGNIAAQDIDGPCCLSYVLVQNTDPFGGGQQARDYPVVDQRDLDGVSRVRVPTLLHSAQLGFQGSIHPNEQLVAPAQCTPSVRPDHPVGSEASQVSVTVSVTCRGEVYDAQGALVLAATLLSQQAASTLGSGYSVVGERVRSQITRVRVVNRRQGTLSLQVTSDGVWAYRFTQARLQQLAQQIAGKRTTEARALLLRVQGIRAVTIDLTGGGGTSLPADPQQISMGLLVVTGW